MKTRVRASKNMRTYIMGSPLWRRGHLEDSWVLATYSDASRPADESRPQRLRRRATNWPQSHTQGPVPAMAAAVTMPDNDSITSSISCARHRPSSLIHPGGSTTLGPNAKAHMIRQTTYLSVKYWILMTPADLDIVQSSFWCLPAMKIGRELVLTLLSMLAILLQH